MRLKPRATFLFFLTLLFAIGIPSCGEDYVVFRDIKNVYILDREAGLYLGTPASTSSDSIALQIEIEFAQFSYNHNSIPGMMSEAWATSPSTPMLANEITDIRIFCDHAIYGIPPGENMAAVLNFGLDYYQATLHDFLQMLPRKGEYTYGIPPMEVYFNSKPDPGTYTFKVEIEDNNRHVFISSFPALEWL